MDAIIPLVLSLCSCTYRITYTMFDVLVMHSLNWHYHHVIVYQVSRLQTGTDICNETYEQIKGELKNPVEDYALFWPEQKVGTYHGTSQRLDTFQLSH